MDRIKYLFWRLSFEEDSVSDQELKKAVSEIIRDKSSPRGLPWTVARVGRAVRIKPGEAFREDWACYVPGEILAQWDEFSEEFKLGVLVVAASDPMGNTAGAAFQND